MCLYGGNYQRTKPILASVSNQTFTSRRKFGLGGQYLGPILWKKVICELVDLDCLDDSIYDIIDNYKWAFMDDAYTQTLTQKTQKKKQNQ